MMGTRIIKIGNRAITVGNEDKILFPKSKITKGELIAYYQRSAPYMLPYTKNRPLSMQRFPDGIGQEGFYQKDASDYFPAWITRCPIKKKADGVVNYVVCDSAATLVYLANQVTIVVHLWLSTIDNLNRPDRMIFDLDPSKKNFRQICVTALQLKKLLEEFGLNPFVMTTGSRGLHIVIPLKQQEAFDTVRQFARDVALVMVARDPGHLTLEVRKTKRKGRIFIDILRNAFGQTGVAPYSVRAKEGAPVATPLDWAELKDRTLRSDKYTIKTIFARLQRKKDPWLAMKRSACSLKKARKQLDALLEREKVLSGA